jgi:hypothetical protein
MSVLEYERTRRIWTHETTLDVHLQDIKTLFDYQPQVGGRITVSNPDHLSGVLAAQLASNRLEGFNLEHLRRDPNCTPITLFPHFLVDDL